MHEFYLEQIKSFEGFAAQAKWDYAQHSVGFGTKARFPGETISPEEAAKRFKGEITAARELVEKYAAQWDEGTKAALTSLTFNSGTRWMSDGLGDAVRAGDIAQVKERFVLYNRAGGEVLPGLVKRRLAESSWIGAAPIGDSATQAPFNLAASSPTPSSPPSVSTGAPTLAARTDRYVTPSGNDENFVAPSARTAPDFIQAPASAVPAGAPRQDISPGSYGIAALSLDALIGILLDAGAHSNREDASDRRSVA